jgi:hypothetical protein
MMKIAANRSLFMRAVCVLAMALVCAMGMVQAVHAHPENSTTTHHACSICVTAHAGVSVEAGPSAPIMLTAALAAPAQVQAGIFRPASSRFIRPPPAV